MKTVKSDKQYIYGARDKTTGKLVSHLTNPRRKYWDREKNARAAIDYYNRGRGYCRGYARDMGNIELVKFELVEVPLDTDTVE